VDAGVMFPEEELYGVDLVIPDCGFLRRSGRKLLGVLLHVGGLSLPPAGIRGSRVRDAAHFRPGAPQGA